MFDFSGTLEIYHQNRCSFFLGRSRGRYPPWWFDFFYGLFRGDHDGFVSVHFLCCTMSMSVYPEGVTHNRIGLFLFTRSVVVQYCTIHVYYYPIRGCLILHNPCLLLRDPRLFNGTQSMFIVARSAVV